jgi:aryl-alcohol dehydrogenase-like predicted oxidoreductase
LAAHGGRGVLEMPNCCDRFNLFRVQIHSLILVFGILTGFVSTSIAEMEYVTLGSSDDSSGQVSVSRLIMGTDHLGKIPPDQIIAVLNEAVRLGINVFDTAPIYVNGIEETLGRWMSTRPEELHVITKGGFPYDNGPGTYESRLKGTPSEMAGAIQEEIDGSFERLNKRKILIYLMHRDDGSFKDYERTREPQTPVGDIQRSLKTCSICGKFKMFGVSNWRPHRVNKAKENASNDPLMLDPVANSPYFSILQMSDVTIHSGGEQVKHNEMNDPEFQPGVKIMSYSPLGGFSIFSRPWAEAKQAALDLKNQGDRYWGHVFDSIFHDANEARFNRVVKFTNDFNRSYGTSYTPDQVANAYVLAHKRADFLIIGPRSVAQLRRTVDSLALSKRLTQDDLDHLFDNSKTPHFHPSRVRFCQRLLGG